MPISFSLSFPSFDYTSEASLKEQCTRNLIDSNKEHSDDNSQISSTSFSTAFPSSTSLFMTKMGRFISAIKNAPIVAAVQDSVGFREELEKKKELKSHSTYSKEVQAQREEVAVAVAVAEGEREREGEGEGTAKREVYSDIQTGSVIETHTETESEMREIIEIDIDNEKGVCVDGRKLIDTDSISCAVVLGGFGKRRRVGEGEDEKEGEGEKKRRRGGKVEREGNNKRISHNSEEDIEDIEDGGEGAYESLSSQNQLFKFENETSLERQIHSSIYYDVIRLGVPPELKNKINMTGASVNAIKEIEDESSSIIFLETNTCWIIENCLKDISHSPTVSFVVTVHSVLPCISCLSIISVIPCISRL